MSGCKCKEPRPGHRRASGSVWQLPEGEEESLALGSWSLCCGYRLGVAVPLCHEGAGHGCCQLLLPKLSEQLFCRAVLLSGVPQPVLLCGFPSPGELRAWCSTGAWAWCTEPLSPLPGCPSPLGLWGYSVGRASHNWLLPRPQFIGFP